MRSKLPFLFWAMLAACNDAGPQAHPDPGDLTCAVPAGADWLSNTLEECGLAEPVDGGIVLALCNWRIAFEPDGTGTWSHSDVFQLISSSSCDGAALDLRISGETLPAAYDPESGLLTFQGVEYCLEGAAGCPQEAP